MSDGAKNPRPSGRGAINDKIPRLQDEQIEAWHDYMDEQTREAYPGSWIGWALITGLIFWIVVMVGVWLAALAGWFSS